MSQTSSSKNLLSKPLSGKILIYLTAVFGILLVTAVLEPVRLQISITTVALSLLLVVLFVATLWGSRPALVSAIVGVLCFNYFFLPPVGTWTIADPENWVAFVAFLVIALTAGQLSARLKRRAEEAESGRIEIERLYTELSSAFEKASHAEALKQSEKLKSALLDAISHDIRSPLTSIKASITILLDEQDLNSNQNERFILDMETRREMLEVIDEETDRLNRFVEGMVELARIEAGEMHIRRRWEAVDEIVSAAIARAEPLIKNHKIQIEIENDLPVVRVDSRAVSEVVYTLIDNAVKYSPGQSTIIFTASRFDNSNVLISVEDEGEGIPANLRERVFDKFFRATRDGDGGESRPTGSGMGLAIAKGIVEAHNGRIWITEGKTGGAKFNFLLPIGDDEKENISEENIEQSFPSENVI